MATAKKVPAKKATNRRKATVKAAPAAKRVVRRRKTVVEEAATTAAPETQANDVLKQDTLTDSDVGHDVGEVEEVEEVNALYSADVVDLRKVGMLGRFAVVLELQLAGYVFDGYSDKDATDMVESYGNELVSGIKLQHRNKLMFPLIRMMDLSADTLITKPVASTISAMVVMTAPDIAPPKELCLGGTVYVKTGT